MTAGPQTDASAAAATDGRGVVVVTGASAGIGRAIAVEFARSGFDVAVIARGSAGLDRVTAEIIELGRRAIAVEADVADFDQVHSAAGEVERELGPIDIWVNDAMTTSFAPSWEVEPDDFRRAVEVTFLGQVWGTMVALELMRPRDQGAIVNIGSALAYLGIPLQSAYCASKFACRGFFESVRAELLHEGSNVRMSMVHMPAVNTPQFGWCETTMSHHPQPVPPIYEPDEVAPYVVQVALDGRRSRVVGSWNRLVVAAAKFVPSYANHYAVFGAWESQLTDIPIDPDRPVNLREPVDADHDQGMRGIFADKAGGVLDSSFLASLPSTAGTFGRAGVSYARDGARWLRRTDRSEHLRLAGTAAGVLAVLGLGNAVRRG